MNGQVEIGALPVHSLFTKPKSTKQTVVAVARQNQEVTLAKLSHTPFFSHEKRGVDILLDPMLLS